MRANGRAALRVRVALILVFLGAGSRGSTKPTTQASSGSPLYELRITTDKTTYALGDPIELTIEVKNKGKTGVGITNLTLWAYFEYSIHLPSAVAVERGRLIEYAPLTVRGHAATQTAGEMGAQSGGIDAGKSIKFGLFRPLNLLYDMSLSGEYTIIVRRKLPNPNDPTKFVTAESKPVTITITNRTPKADPD